MAFRRARIIVTPSRGLARELESVYGPLVRGKIQIIPNPVDVESFARPLGFSPQPVYRRFGIPEDAFVISLCALGNFEWKGLPLILEALQRLHDSSIHLLVVGGSSPEVLQFQSEADRLNISRSVHFAGIQPEIQPFLWSSHAFVFPSIYEGFPLVCLQAAAAGLPLIATRVNGVEEFVIHNVNGFLIERTAESIYSAIANAAANRTRTAAMGRAARQSVEIYDEAHFRARWLTLFAEELGIEIRQVQHA
jgi:glycosyltransferase involved in cell wall biosynthesis